jgi:hypothetical protein
VNNAHLNSVASAQLLRAQWTCEGRNPESRLLRIASAVSQDCLALLTRARWKNQFVLRCNVVRAVKMPLRVYPQEISPSCTDLLIQSKQILSVYLCIGSHE